MYHQWNYNIHPTKESLLKAISEIEPESETSVAHLGKAMAAVTNGVFKEELGRRPDVPAVVVLITDGTSQDKFSEQAELLKKYASVIVIGVKQAKKEELKVAATSREDDHFVFIVEEETDSIPSIATEVTDSVCDIAVEEDECKNEEDCSCIMENGKTVYKGKHQ